MQVLFPVLLLVVLAIPSYGQQAVTESGPIFPKGNRGPANNFTGTVWVHLLVAPDSTYTTSVGSVLFEPGARTNWHSHQAGQLLLVTDGEGLYQEQGKPIQRLHKGDVIKCQPDITHWHGASPGTIMTHIAINPNTEKGVVIWKQPVTDQEYNNHKN
ncbi:hypothetical protein GCM10027577_31130 [Spirosoma fluminis]